VGMFSIAGRFMGRPKIFVGKHAGGLDNAQFIAGYLVGSDEGSHVARRDEPRLPLMID